MTLSFWFRKGLYSNKKRSIQLSKNTVILLLLLCIECEALSVYNIPCSDNFLTFYPAFVNDFTKSTMFCLQLCDVIVYYLFIHVVVLLYFLHISHGLKFVLRAVLTTFAAVKLIWGILLPLMLSKSIENIFTIVVCVVISYVCYRHTFQ